MTGFELRWYLEYIYWPFNILKCQMTWISSTNQRKLSYSIVDYSHLRLPTSYLETLNLSGPWNVSRPVFYIHQELSLTSLIFLSTSSREIKQAKHINKLNWTGMNTCYYIFQKALRERIQRLYFNELGCGSQVSTLTLAFHPYGPSRAGCTVTRILWKGLGAFLALASRKTDKQVEKKGKLV